MPLQLRLLRLLCGVWDGTDGSAAAVLATADGSGGVPQRQGAGGGAHPGSGGEADAAGGKPSLQTDPAASALGGGEGAVVGDGDIVLTQASSEHRLLRQRRCNSDQMLTRPLSL